MIVSQKPISIIFTRHQTITFPRHGSRLLVYCSAYPRLLPRSKFSLNTTWETTNIHRHHGG